MAIRQLHDTNMCITDVHIHHALYFSVTDIVLCDFPDHTFREVISFLTCLWAVLCQDSPYLQNSSFFGAIRPHILLKGKGKASSLLQWAENGRKRDRRILRKLFTGEYGLNSSLSAMYQYIWNWCDEWVAWLWHINIFLLLNFDHCMHVSIWQSSEPSIVF